MGLLYKDRNTERLLETARNDVPLSVQLFGREPEILAEAAARVADILGEDLLTIDLNMGCPVPKIVRGGEGSALMLEPERAGRIVEAVTKAVRVPVSVKIRKGFDEERGNAAEFAKVLEDSGASLIAVHGRTRSQMYSGKADLGAIAEVKRSVRIPVIGNGDITGAESALRMLDETGCDGVMVGRGALGNPWVFRQIRAALDGKAAALPTQHDRIAAAVRLAEMTVEDKGERGIVELRKHLCYYLKGMKGASEIRRNLQLASDLDTVVRILLDTECHG